MAGLNWHLADCTGRRPAAFDKFVTVEDDN